MGDSVGNNFLVDGDVIAHNLVTFYDWHAYGPPVCSFTCFGTQVIWFAQVNRIVIDTLRMQYQNPTSYWKSWKDHLTISFLLMIRWYGNIWWQIWRTITQCWCSMNRWHSARLAQWLWPPTQSFVPCSRPISGPMNLHRGWRFWTNRMDQLYNDSVIVDAKLVRDNERWTIWKFTSNFLLLQTIQEFIWQYNEIISQLLMNKCNSRLCSPLYWII